MRQWYGELKKFCLMILIYFSRCKEEDRHLKGVTQVYCMVLFLLQRYFISEICINCSEYCTQARVHACMCVRFIECT